MSGSAASQDDPYQNRETFGKLLIWDQYPEGQQDPGIHGDAAKQEQPPPIRVQLGGSGTDHERESIQERNPLVIIDHGNSGAGMMGAVGPW